MSFPVSIGTIGVHPGAAKNGQFAIDRSNVWYFNLKQTMPGIKYLG